VLSSAIDEELKNCKETAERRQRQRWTSRHKQNMFERQMTLQKVFVTRDSLRLSKQALSGFKDVQTDRRHVQTDGDFGTSRWHGYPDGTVDSAYLEDVSLDRKNLSSNGIVG
jgi:hypothetical protein